MATNDAPVLRIDGYGLSYQTRSGPVRALSDISLNISHGRTLGLVGESGSGKSSMAYSVMRYLAPNAREDGGRILLEGEDLRTLSPAAIARIRGRRAAMVFQDPSTSLNPAMTLGDQITEVLERHRGLDRPAARAEGEAALARTGILRPADMMRRYPHQASGGEKQRVVIATAFACQPALIVFDEPTTALDTITAQGILELFRILQTETGVSALYISHDLALVSRVADDVAVIHDGRIVETGAPGEIFSAPRNTYTKALIAAVPRPDRWMGVPPPAVDAVPVLAADRIGVLYGAPSRLAQRLGIKGRPHWGARNVSLSVRPGELLGIVGESGSGKSTIAKVLAGLIDFGGGVSFEGRDFRKRKDFDSAYRRAVQIVFQHPDASLNPRQTIGRILARPLIIYGLAPRAERPARVRALLERVRLPAEFAERYPHQLSGGEKQRVAIARAFAAEPELVICDEITAALDVSVQASVAELLMDLQRETGTACLFITHDLNLVRQLAHRIAVMQDGLLVDIFDRNGAEDPDRAQYTRALLDAVPKPAGVKPPTPFEATL
ncbi:MAG: ABC transporter ATP-binding protein [Pseudomonadota bacterium]